MDPAALQDTVNVYNAVSASGATDEFGRTEGCIAFADGAMYAIKVAPGIHHEMGGIRINAKNQALDASGAPIPGLYAAGEVTGGIHGDNRIGGNAVCDIEVFGKNVGEAVAEGAGVADAVRCGGRGGGLSAPRRARFAFLVFGPCRRFGARWGSARLGEDLLFHHESFFILPTSFCRASMQLGRMSAPMSTYMMESPHGKRPFVEPHAHVVHAGPGERFGNGCVHAGRIVGELHLGDVSQSLDAFTHLLFRRHAHHAVVREEHAALRGLRILLRLGEPLIDGRFLLGHGLSSVLRPPATRRRASLPTTIIVAVFGLEEGERGFSKRLLVSFSPGFAFCRFLGVFPVCALVFFAAGLVLQASPV